ncbi:FAD:protein FMN transferase, partial [bacterium]|nr:FAD:protein FMN transferase [bacterium]
AALMACRQEVSAIETAFSIYDPDSMLSHLNRDGKIKSDARFSSLVRHALAMAETTGGAFDPTIQPLWRAFATGADPVKARRHIGWRGLLLDEGEVRFARPEMAASFNGIAQGFAADQVSAILAQHGFEDTLVNLGEFAARGTKRGGPWTLGIRAPSNGRIIARIKPVAGAIATSEPRSMLVAGHPHIIDPLERAGERWLSVTVEASDAWRADALSTAIASSPIKQAESLLASGGATRGWLITGTGALHEWFANEKAYG